MRNLLFALLLVASSVTLGSFILSRQEAPRLGEVDQSSEWLPPVSSEVLSGSSADGVEVLVRARSHRKETWRFRDLSLARRLDPARANLRFVEVLLRNGSDHELSLRPDALCLVDATGRELRGEALESPDATDSSVRHLLAAFSGVGTVLGPGQGARFLVAFEEEPAVATCSGGRYGEVDLKPRLASTEDLNQWVEEGRGALPSQLHETGETPESEER